MADVAQIYEALTERPREILSILNEFFGEDKVDMQIMEEDTFIRNGYTEGIPDEASVEDTVEQLYTKMGYFLVLIHYPVVRVTNENNRYIDITDLFIQLAIRYDGTLFSYFEMNRSSYTKKQYMFKYRHSHLPLLCENRPEEFRTPCLGHGPIKSTMDYLKGNYNLDIWKLFCVELDKYVHTESLAGGPYIKLENVGGTKIFLIKDSQWRISPPLCLKCLSTSLRNKIISEFIPAFIEKNLLTFSYINGNYFLGMSLTKYILIFNDAFFHWLKSNTSNIPREELEELQNKCFRLYIIEGNKIYTSTVSNISPNPSPVEICVFKGNPVNLRIVEDKDINDNRTILLELNIAFYVLYKILKELNYAYRNH